MQIALGQPVYTSDGQRIGTIDRVLLNPASNRVVHFVVHRGFFFDDDKLVARSAIARVEASGVHLSLDAEEAKSLNRFERTFDTGEAEPGLPDLNLGPFQSGVLFPTAPAGMAYLEHGRLFQLEPIEGRSERSLSDATPNDVVIGKGADVVGSDGHRIGYVHEVDYDDEGALLAVTVQTGLLRHHRVSIPVEQIAQIGDEEIMLRVPADALADTA